MPSFLDLLVVWPLLHGGDLRFIRPPESHHVFGAGMLFVGALMMAESYSGKVWHNNSLRKLMFPCTLVLLGWGMLAVTALEPRARLVHTSMGIPMIVGGWAEARCRLENYPRKYADAWIVPALALASVDTLLFHLNGPPTGSIVITHGGLAILALAVAGLRLYQSRQPQSLARGLLLGFAVMAVGLDLWLDAFFQ